MKLFLNISALICVLSVPFALSSQTRKAIPAGRYEALSGVKNSRSGKTPSAIDEAQLKNESANLVWNEALKLLPAESKDISYYSSTELDPVWSDLLSTKGMIPSKKIGNNTQVIFSDDLRRDKDLFTSVNAGKIVILKDKQPLKDIISPSNHFEILAYQATDENQHLYLLKIK